MLPAGEHTARAVPAGLVLAPIGRRMAALLLDRLLVAMPVLVVLMASGFRPGDSLSSRSLLLLNLSVTVAALIYETVMVAMLGRTVGKIALGTRVVRLVDGGRPGWSEAAMRALVPLALGAIPTVGLLLTVMVYSLALWSPLRQGLHDKAAGTLVVRNVAG